MIIAAADVQRVKDASDESASAVAAAQKRAEARQRLTDMGSAFVAKGDFSAEAVAAFGDRMTAEDEAVAVGLHATLLAPLAEFVFVANCEDGILYTALL